MVFLYLLREKKGGTDTEALSEELLEELNSETVFTIPLFGGIAVAESVVVTWIIMAAVLILCLCFVRGFQVRTPGKRQLIIESLYTSLHDFFEDIVSHEGKRYIPYLISVAIYLGIANLIGLIGFKPPTKDLNVTASLSAMSILLIEYAGIYQKGVKGWLHGFAEPIAIIAPINVLEIVIKPLSLCMRLFGNILGAFVVMELLKILVPVLLPVPFSLYFDIFDGLIQAYVFVFLTSLFIREVVE